MSSIIRSLKYLIISPAIFFEKHSPGETVRFSSGIVILYSICLTITPILIGSLIAGAVDTTIAVDNPQRPSSAICNAEDIAESTRERCKRPETVARDVGELVRPRISSFLWLGFVVPVVMWPLGWGVLYGAGRIAGGTPSLDGTFSLAGWAALPETVRVVVTLAGLQLTLGNATITETDPERLGEILQTTTAPIETLILGVSLVTLGWQWSLLSGGLAEDADIQWNVAAVCVAVPLAVFGLLTLW